MGSQDKQQNETEHLQTFSNILYDLVTTVTKQEQEQTTETRAVDEETAAH